MLELSTSTPKDIMSLKLDEVLELVEQLSDVTCDKVIPVKVRHAVITHMYKLFNYQLSNDLLLALLTDTKQQLILAPAGGCKTSSSQTKLIATKIFWQKLYGYHLTSDQCLCLVYNAENRIQMDQKHVELLTPLVMNGFISYDARNPAYVNPGITSHTLHSFSNYWLKQYLDELGLTGFEIISEEYAATFLNTAINKARMSSEVPTSKKCEATVDRFQTLYDLVAGLQLQYSDILDKHPLLSECIQSCVLSPEEIVSVFENYDKSKRFFKRYDFTDMLKIMDGLLDKPEVQQRMHILYPCMVVDEVQDFTPLMMSILRKLVGPNTRLLAIGDEDQSIYGFRGADVNNAVRFTERFPNSKVFQLLVNRRCGENILEAAEQIITMNKNRYDKDLEATRPHGLVDMVPYSSEAEQLDTLINSITNYSAEEQGSTVVCTREKAYGQPISFELFMRRVPFYCFNTLRFDRHEGFRSFMDVMKLVMFPNRQNWKSLYKCINVKKDDWFNYIGYDPKKDTVSNFQGVESLWELEFEPFSKYRGFMEIIKKLEDIYRNINTYYASDYMDYLITLFKQNFWEYRVSMSRIQFDQEVFSWISTLFCKAKPLPGLYDTFNERIQSCTGQQQAKAGIAVATFHALKGLEYKNVHVAYLDDAIFPAYASIDARNYPKDYTADLKEAENRLAYVAFTRAKDRLVLHYARYNPSLYVTRLQGSKSVSSMDLKLDDNLFKPNQVVFSNKKVW